MISTIIAFIRSTLYHLIFMVITLAMGVFYLPSLLSNKGTLARDIPYRWTKIALWLQRYILGLRYNVISHVELPKGRAMYAVKHQSAWETIALWHIIDRPVFVLKKELLDIPVFGWYLARADNIVIDRSKGQKAVGQIIEQSMKYLMDGRNIVMFPEGTRTPVGAKARYKHGIANVYEALTPLMHPVAHNAGCFWPRNGYIRRSGIVDIEIFPPLPTDLEKEECMAQLKSTIETATQKLVESANYGR